MINKLTKIFIREGFTGVWLRVKNQLWSLNLYCHRTLKRKVVTSRYGVKFVQNYTDATFSFYITGKYGSTYWNHISSIDSNFLFLDIGANQGLYTLCAAKNKNCVKCFAYEPVSKTFELLNQNISLNGCQEKCATYKKAISHESGKCNLYSNPNHSGTATLHEQNKAYYQAKSILETIETVTGEEIDRHISTRNPLPVYVKIDVEGFELTVIKELMKTKISENIVEIYYEIDEQWVDPNSIESILRNHGFTSFSSKPNTGNHYDIFARKF